MIENALNTLQQYNGAITAIATVVVMAATVIYSILTFGLLNENRLLRKAGIASNVVVFLKPDAKELNVINLVITNVGRGAAKNVRIKYLTDISELKNFNLKSIFDGKAEILSILAPDDQFSAFYGVSFSLKHDGKFLHDFDAEVTFSDLDGTARKSICRLNLSGLMGISRIRDDHSRDIAENLKRISETMRGWSRHERLKVETITAVEQRGAEEKAHAEFVEFEKGLQAAESGKE